MVVQSSNKNIQVENSNNHHLAPSHMQTRTQKFQVSQSPFQLCQASYDKLVSFTYLLNSSHKNLSFLFLQWSHSEKVRICQMTIKYVGLARLLSELIYWCADWWGEHCKDMLKKNWTMPSNFIHFSTLNSGQNHWGDLCIQPKKWVNIHFP